MMTSVAFTGTIGESDADIPLLEDSLCELLASAHPDINSSLSRCNPQLATQSPVIGILNAVSSTLGTLTTHAPCQAGDGEQECAPDLLDTSFHVTEFESKMWAVNDSIEQFPKLCEC